MYGDYEFNDDDEDDKETKANFEQVKKKISSARIRGEWTREVPK